jgi:hypothetical protein
MKSDVPKRNASLAVILLVILLASLAQLLWAQTSPTRPESMPPHALAHHRLDQTDHRKPLILPAMMAAHQRQNMRQHLVAVQEIASALAGDDFAGVERVAKKLGYSEQMGQMCNMMGAATPGFTPMALNFHHTADGIADAARRHDRSAVLTALGNTLATCTTCHATFRQEVVDEKTWQGLTEKSMQ